MWDMTFNPIFPHKYNILVVFHMIAGLDYYFIITNSFDFKM